MTTTTLDIQRHGAVARVFLNRPDVRNAFNDAVGSLESRVLPSARRFRDLGAAAGPEIGVLKTVDAQPRSLDAPELPGVEAAG